MGRQITSIALLFCVTFGVLATARLMDSASRLMTPKWIGSGVISVPDITFEGTWFSIGGVPRETVVERADGEVREVEYASLPKDVLIVDAAKVQEWLRLGSWAARTIPSGCRTVLHWSARDGTVVVCARVGGDGLRGDDSSCTVRSRAQSPTREEFYQGIRIPAWRVYAVEGSGIALFRRDGLVQFGMFELPEAYEFAAGPEGGSAGGNSIQYAVRNDGDVFFWVRNE